MTKPKKRNGEAGAKATGLPICTALFFADHAVTGDDNTITAVRNVDTVNLPKSPPIEHGNVLQLVPLKLVLILKKADAQGEFDITLASVSPDGTKTTFATIGKYVFEGDPETGVNTITPVPLSWWGPGLYWIHLEANGHLVARTPLRIKVPEEKTDAAAPVTKRTRKPHKR